MDSEAKVIRTCHDADWHLPAPPLSRPCFPAPSSAADSRQSCLLPHDWGVRPEPSPLRGSPRSHTVPAGPPVAGTGETHPLPKESPPGNTAEPPRRPRHPTSPPPRACACLKSHACRLAAPEEPLLAAGQPPKQGGCGPYATTTHPPKAGVVELPPQGLASRTRIRLPCVSAIGAGSCGPPACHRTPFVVTLPRGRPRGRRWAQEACRRRDGVCVQQRACAHVREKEAGLRAPEAL